MTAELTAMWATIATAWPHALQAIPRSSQPSDGQPTGTQINAPSPVNDTAQSWCAEVEQMVFGWTPNTYTPFATPLSFLTYRFHHQDVQDRYEPTAIAEELLPQLERLAKEATRFIPAHTQVTGITATQAKTAQVHCETIELLAKTLKAIGHNRKPTTLRDWIQYGWLTKTSKGYPLWQALEHLENTTRQ